MTEGTGGGRFCGETAQNRAAQQAAGHSAGVPGQVRKSASFASFYTKMCTEYLSRQSRDKHREILKRRFAGEDPLVNGIYAEDFIAQMQGQEQGGAAMNWSDPHAAPLKAGKN